MKNMLQRLVSKMEDAFDWTLDHPVRTFGILAIIAIPVWAFLVFVRPCTGTGPSTCPVMCTGVSGETVYTYVCGESECVVCTQRQWFWEVD